jgi:eukaryotic-like serine/threonine-protein kinase
MMSDSIRNPGAGLALSISRMAVLSRLLDEVLPLDEAGRWNWLQTLAPEYADLAQTLRDALFPDPAKSSILESLNTLPSLGSDDEENSGGETGLKPGERVGPYQLIRPIGTGGMAEVWLARRADGTFNREVALKLPIALHRRRDLEARFARERDILASMSHPNIARLYDTGFTENGQPYLALEYVAGSPITSFCDELRLTLRQRLELFQQVLDAVHYAHANLVIHRDLKPPNILVSREGRAQLLDFGIAKLLTGGSARETELTRLTGRALTPDYAAPEQILGAQITTAADVYALGVMLYEILTGDRPYRLKRTTDSALEEAIVKTDPVAPSRASLTGKAATARNTTPKKLAKMLRGDLDTITLKALKKAPGERYATAAAFREDISRYLQGGVVLARPDKLSYRAYKFARRHWLVLSLVSAIVLALIVGLAAASYEASVAATQRDIARLEAATSEEVTTYLESLFDLANPDRTGGKPIDARALVEQGQKEIAAIPNGQQLLRGRMLAAVGALDCKVGKSAECREYLEAALRIQSAQHNADPLRIARMRYQLATAYNSLGRVTEAVALLQQARGAFEQHEPPDKQQLAAIWYQIGYAARITNRVSDARQAFERARMLLRDAHGNDTLAAADALGQLAIVLGQTSRTREAADLANKRLEMVRKGFGTDDLRYIEALNDYAEVANDNAEAAAAEHAWLQVIAAYIRIFGNSSDKVVDTELSLADAFFRQDKLSDAITWFRKAAEHYRANGATGNIGFTGALGGLSQVLTMHGDYTDAEASAREAYETTLHKYGASESDLAITRMGWGRGLVLIGNTGQAMTLLRPEIPDDDTQALYARSFRAQRLLWIAECYRRMGQLKQAEDGYDAVLAYYRSINRTQGIGLAMAYEAKANLLAGEKRYSEAAPLYRTAIQDYASGHYLPDGPTTAAAKIELAQCLFGLGQHAEARSLVEEVGTVVERQLAPGHPAQAVLVKLRKALHSSAAPSAH